VSASALRVAERLEALDVLRGVAVLIVLVSHASRLWPTPWPEVNHWLATGRFGVQLFFLVSAWTICHMWMQRATEPARTRRFYIRRFLRIAPLFWLAIAVYLLANGTGPSYWAPEGIQTRDIALTATFLHIWWPSSITSVVPGGWSIGVEMSFYLLFPLLACWCLRGTRMLWLAVAIYTANKALLEPTILAWLQTAYQTSRPGLLVEFLYLGLLNQLPVFLVGCQLYLWQRDGLASWKAVLAPLLTWVLIAIALRALGMRPIGMDMMIALPLLCALVAAALRWRWRQAWLQRWGRWSYSMYLSHFLVLGALAAAWSAAGLERRGYGLLLMLPAALLLTSALSALTHRWIEQPLFALARRLTGGASQ
jgi:peptidoglycan/LPS O-acetylase OafA/YrhL